MKIFTAVLTFRETHIDPVYGRIFEAHMSGDRSGAFGSLFGTQCALTSSQAIAHLHKVEKRAFEYSQAAKQDLEGNPIESKINVDIVFDFLPEES